MDDQQLIALFRHKNLKVTTQRLVVSKYILSRKDHPSAEQIHTALKPDFPTISLATVYKTLNLLEKIGLVQELGFRDGVIRYDPNTALHINLICTECDSIRDYTPEHMGDWLKSVLSDIEITPIGQRIDVYHICEKCKTKKR